MGRNHKTVDKITRYFKSKIYIDLSQKLFQFRHIQRPNNLTYQISQENKLVCLHLYHSFLILLQSLKLYKANRLSDIFHSGYQLDFQTSRYFAIYTDRPTASRHVDINKLI